MLQVLTLLRQQRQLSQFRLQILMPVLQAGALLAAEHARDDLPEEWLEQVTKLDDYKDLAGKLVSQRAIISILPP